VRPWGGGRKYGVRSVSEGGRITRHRRSNHFAEEIARSLEGGVGEPASHSWKDVITPLPGVPTKGGTGQNADRVLFKKKPAVFCCVFWGGPGAAPMQ